MNTTLSRTMILVAVASLIAIGSPSPAQAGPAAQIGPATGPVMAKLEWPDASKLVPKVKFKASGKLNKTTAKIRLYAQLTFAGKTKNITIFDMGLKKKGKSVQVKRKIGKLKVSLKVSWSGKRSITIKGTARYLKFKVPVPKLTIRL